MAIWRKEHTEEIGGEKLQRPSINAGLFMKSAKNIVKTDRFGYYKVPKKEYLERNYSAQVSKLAIC